MQGKGALSQLRSPKSSVNPLALRRSIRNAAADTRMKAAKLDDSTEWNLSLSFAKEGSSAFDIMSARVKFIEDVGYEPPQGTVQVLGDNTYLSASPQTFWKLGEDPAKEGFDKAGFWIWGLFEEPAYPFFFFELDVLQEIPMADGVIPVGKIFAQAQVTRSKEEGVTLSEGKLIVKEYTDYQADLIGLSSAKVGTEVQCGTFTARAVQ